MDSNTPFKFPAESIDNYEDVLSCPVCLGILEEAVIVNCCFNTFCKECILVCSRKCPYCNILTDYNPNITVRNLVDSFRTKGHCIQKNRIDRSKIFNHVAKKCRLCEFKGNDEERARHGILYHNKNILEKYFNWTGK
jgi:hypothetical protein